MSVDGQAPLEVVDIRCNDSRDSKSYNNKSLKNRRQVGKYRRSATGCSDSVSVEILGDTCTLAQRDLCRYHRAQ